MDADAIEVRRLSSLDVHAHLDGLARVLADCVAGGASVSYMAPFSHDDARGVFEAVAAEVEQDRRLLFAAFADGDVVGTVQVILALPQNQPHRAEIAKLLVHRAARRRGIAQRLMERAEAEARAEGRTLLVLDAVTGGDAERLYVRIGWTKVGVIPGYALFPDGRPCDTTYFWKSLQALEMPFRVIRPDEFAWRTRDHAPDEAARHVAELSELAGFVHTRANVWRYEPGAKGRRHRHTLQEETFVVLAGTLSMYLGDPPERQDVSTGGIIHVSPGTSLQTVNHGAEDLVVYAYGTPPESEHAELLDPAL